jgi:putative oxidoreductase
LWFERWRRNGLLFKVLTLLELMFSDGVGGRLKALASTKLKVKTASRQSSNRVRAYRTHPTHWFLSSE